MDNLPSSARHAKPARESLAAAAAWMWDRRPRLHELHHRHYYHPVAATYLPGTGILGGIGRTSVTLKCWCTRPDQYTFVLLPGRLELDDIVTADSPGLISLAAMRKIMDQAAQREEAGQ